eukprot:TRINITY_DN172_c0_g1_i1.p1 TRINITY_DN172_c0_g1~~TRINITY_DN172_c0_g1_i1.p1  ORF type:complete len:152 (+),score=22.33 TRINITY_DN172_c0_g1_i1:140-595(+)
MEYESGRRQYFVSPAFNCGKIFAVLFGVIGMIQTAFQAGTSVFAFIIFRNYGTIIDLGKTFMGTVIGVGLLGLYFQRNLCYAYIVLYPLVMYGLLYFGQALLLIQVGQVFPGIALGVVLLLVFFGVLKIVHIAYVEIKGSLLEKSAKPIMV